MSQVLVTDGKGIRFVADKYKYQPAALADMTEGDGKMRDERMAEKQAITDKLVGYVNERNERISRAQIDAASLIQAGVLTKAANHKAQKVLSGGATVIQMPTPVEWDIYNEM